jgi:uncharacterized protein (DUF488 family)
MGGSEQCLMAGSLPHMEIFTLGYQGHSLSTYIEVLDRAAIDLVVDIRETPWSYKPGFSKKPLSLGLEHAGIKYIHLKSAGNPAQNRRTARTKKECLGRYKKHLQRNSSCLEELSEILSTAQRENQRVCLTCFERHADECHRSVLINELGKRIGGLCPVHLATEIVDRELSSGTISQRL